MGSCCVRVSFSGLLPCAREAFLGSCCVRARLSWGAVCARGFSGLAHYKMQTKCKTKANACICVAWKASFSICAARKASFSATNLIVSRIIESESRRCMTCKQNAKKTNTSVCVAWKASFSICAAREASFSSSCNKFDRFENDFKSKRCIQCKQHAKQSKHLHLHCVESLILNLRCPESLILFVPQQIRSFRESLNPNRELRGGKKAID